jgi:DHA3 family macrolide efflux protein-like MFS transporter
MAQTVSLLGDSIYFLVFMFMAKQASDNNFQVGLVMTASAVPFLLLSPVAGVVADRFDRKLIMVWADLSSAILTGALAVIAWFDPVPSTWLIGSFAFLLSCVNAFFMPARMAAMPRVLPEDKLAQGNAVFMVTQQAMWMLGTAFSATLLVFIEQAFNEKFFFVAAIFNSLTFLFSSYWVLRLPNLRPIPSEHHEEPKSGMAEVLEGLRTVFRNPVLQVALPANLLAQASISGFFIAYLEANELWFGGDFKQFAWIEMSFAIPMAIFGFVVGRLTIRRPGYAYSLATGIVGVTVLMMAFGRELWVFMLWNALAGIAIPFAWLPLQTYIQAAFHDQVRGRVSSAWVSSQMSVQPIGMLLVGPMIDGIGLAESIMVMGGGMAVAGFAGLFFPGCRNAEMPQPQAQAV